MPCFFTSCEPTYELVRLFASVLGLYIFHAAVDAWVIRPIVHRMVKNRWIPAKKYDQCRESFWKNVAVACLFAYGWSIVAHEPWFMSKEGYWENWPYKASEALRWYYTLYASFWIQGIDFLCSITKVHYKVKRKDRLEMIIHHVVTLTLMLFSYAMDFTKIGVCILMIHDVNDLLLETAKIFVYMELQVVADIVFATFAVVWYALRWYFYTSNILMSVFYNAYETIYLNVARNGGYGGLSPSTYFGIWCGFCTFLSILLVLHVYWGSLIGSMVYKALVAGKIEKDIRSDSENEEEISSVSKDSKTK